jgi:chromosome segregation ATPase
MQLQPKAYKYKDGTSGRIHTGFIAQECRDLFCPNWGVYVQNGDSIGLRYEEFVSLNSRSIQQLNNRLIGVEQKMRTIGQLQTGEAGTSINLFDLDDIKTKVESFESRLNSSLNIDYNNDINNIKSRLGVLESKLESSSTIDYINQVCNGTRLDINDIKSRLETIETKVKTSLTREHVSVMNDNMYDKIMSNVDSKLERERQLKEQKAREIETVINNFATEFRQQILGLTDRINQLVTQCSQSQTSIGELSSLVEKVNLLVIRCNDLENIRERYTQNLKQASSDQTELISSFESSFRDQMRDLINRVESLSNELELTKNMNESLRNEFALVNNVLNRVNQLSSDIDTIRETHRQSVQDQLQVNNTIETSFRQQLIDLVEKVNLLATDLDTIKEVVTQSSKEQKSEELELINRLMEKINQLSAELDSIKETRSQEVSNDDNSKSEEMELINSLMSKNLLNKQFKISLKVVLLILRLNSGTKCWI